MYAPGDKVVHPGYGPGVILSIEHRQMLGEEKQYYIIEMLTGGGTLMTPVANADTIGLRPAITPVTLKKLFRLLSEAPGAVSEDFRERQLDIEERLKEGDVFTTAAVIRDLTWFGQVHGLTKRDTQLVQRAEELLAAELALVEDIEVTEATERLLGIVTEAMRAPAEVDASTE
jgi:CarD family transcriptional regulator